MTGTPSGGSARRLLIAWREKGIAPGALQAGWKKKKLDMPIAAYPGVYAKDESGKWRVTEAKRGVPQLDGVVRTTAKGMSPSSAVPADGADGCTAFVVGRKASATGRVIVGHNNDGFGPMKYAILPATDSAPALEEPGRAGGLGGGSSTALYWQAVYSDKAKAGKATGDVLLNEHGVMAFPNILPVGRILPGDVVSEGIAGRRESFDFSAAYQGVRTKHDPSQRHRIVEFYREAAGVAVNERELPWSVRPAHLVTVDDLKRGFSSHAVGQGRVSVHPEEVPGVAWPVCRLKTLESVICRFAENPADTAIYLAPGRPCETRYDEFRPFRDAPPPYFATGAAAEALLSSRFVQTSAWRESR